MKPCPSCDGAGMVDDHRPNYVKLCQTCQGDGQIEGTPEPKPKGSVDDMVKAADSVMEGLGPEEKQHNVKTTENINPDDPHLLPPGVEPRIENPEPTKKTDDDEEWDEAPF